MPRRLEIALKPELLDAEGQGIRTKARNYFGIDLQQVRTVSILTFDADFTDGQFGRLQQEIFNQTLGVYAGDRVERRHDPQVLKAIQLLSE